MSKPTTCLILLAAAAVVVAAASAAGSPLPIENAQATSAPMETSTTADQPPPAPETLDQAWDIALRANHDIRAGVETVSSAQQEIAVAKAGKSPKLVLHSGYTTFSNEPTVQSEFPFNVGGITQDIPFEYAFAQKNSLNYSAMGVLPLYNGGQTKAAVLAAETRFDAAQSDQQTQIANTKLAVAEAYLNVLRAQRGKQVASTYVANLEQHHRDVAGAHRQGLVARNDLLTADVLLADARQQLLQVENQQQLAAAAYNQLLARPLDQAVVLAEFRSEGQPPAGTLTTWLDQARERPELTALRHQIESTGAQAKGIAGAALPKVNLAAGYLYQQNDFLKDEGGFTMSLNMDWAVYDGGIARHQTNALRYRRTELERRREGMIEMIALQVRRSWLLFQEAQQRVVVTRGAIVQADENLAVARNNYREGLIRNTEVLDAETLHLKTQTNYTNAIYDAALAALQLRWAAGQL